ncbi:MAG: phage holin family protein [Patescibacteria group bacterium]
MRILLRWLISALAVFLVPYVIPGVHILNFYTALIAALVIGLVNAIIRPILFLLTLPITIVTLGLFTLVLNAIMFWFASTIVKGFYVDGFLAALLGSLVYWLIAWLGNGLVGTKEPRG